MVPSLHPRYPEYLVADGPVNKDTMSRHGLVSSMFGFSPGSLTPVTILKAVRVRIMKIEEEVIRAILT